MRYKTLREIRRLDPVCWGPLRVETVLPAFGLPAARTARVARALRLPPRCKGIDRPICPEGCRIEH
ncbi:hypothetical protein DYH09_31095 [bacterium CPR1]|nr:hypothetical protein [bacterium CPR1]